MPDEEHDVTQAFDKPLPGESSKWFARYLLFRNQKPASRSYLNAYNIYASQANKGVNKRYNRIPGAWDEASKTYKWMERAQAYDLQRLADQEIREAVLREIEAAERERILTTGYALMEKRITGLDRMAKLIEKSFVDAEEEDKINFKWLTPDKVREYRGCLDDIAKELGHRVKKQEIAGTVEIQRNPNLAHLTNEELDQLAELLTKANHRQDLADDASSV